MPNLVKEKESILSICNKLHITPVIVTKDMEIIDGQHRFLACKNLGLPVYYYIDENFKMQDLACFNNSTTRWTSKDYVKFYACSGNVACIFLETLSRKYNISTDNLLSFSCADDGNNYKSLRNGKLKIVMNEETIMERINFVEQAVKFITEKSVKKPRFINSKPLFKALVKIRSQGWFDEERFFHTLEINLLKFRQCSKTSTYYEMLVDIYNFKLRNKIVAKSISRN